MPQAEVGESGDDYGDAGGDDSSEEEHAMCSETALGQLCQCGMQCEANEDCAKIKAKNC